MIIFLKNFKKFPEFLKYTIFLRLYQNTIWTIFFTIIVKLEGLIFSLSVLGFIGILRNISNLFIILFKKYKVKNLLKILLILDVLFFIFSFVYYFNVKLFLIINVIFGIFYSMIIPAEKINFENLIVSYYKKDFKNFRYFFEYSNFIGAIIGGLIVVFFSFNSFKIYQFLDFFNIIFQFYFYNKFFVKGEFK